jgi:hypothetical protein
VTEKLVISWKRNSLAMAKLPRFETVSNMVIKSEGCSYAAIWYISSVFSFPVFLIQESGTNPQADLQAMDPVGSIEERMLKWAVQKLRLDQLVDQQGRMQ